MANLTGFPNNQATVNEPPFMFDELSLSQLEEPGFTGMPIGTAIVCPNVDSSGAGTYAIKMTNCYNNAGDWIALGGTFVAVGYPLND